MTVNIIKSKFWPVLGLAPQTDLKSVVTLTRLIVRCDHRPPFLITAWMDTQENNRAQKREQSRKSYL
jgi:hypothetical protein